MSIIAHANPYIIFLFSAQWIMEAVDIMRTKRSEYPRTAQNLDTVELHVCNKEPYSGCDWAKSSINDHILINDTIIRHEYCCAAGRVCGVCVS